MDLLNLPKGKFILTVDGLYYDSQTGGLDPALAEIMEYDPPDELRFLFDHEPAAGGKGLQVTKADVEGVVNHLFDPNSIDDTLDLKEFYDADHFLKNLIAQKNKEVFDLSGQITTLYSFRRCSICYCYKYAESPYTLLLIKTQVRLTGVKSKLN